MTTESIPQNITHATITGMRIPLIHQLYRLLRELEQKADGLLIVSHRALANLLRCSAGLLPRLMRQLEALGTITRMRIANTYAITVIVGDRAINELIEVDRPIIDDQSTPDAHDPQPPAEYAPADQQRSTTITPTPPSMISMSMSMHARARAYHGDDRPPEVATRKLWRAMCDHNPDYTATDYEADVQMTMQRRDVAGRPNAVRIVIYARSRGLPLYPDALPEPLVRQAPPSTDHLTPEALAAMLGDGWTMGGGYGLAEG